MFHDVEFNLLEFDEGKLEELYHKTLYNFFRRTILTLFIILILCSLMILDGIGSLFHLFFFIMLSLIFLCSFGMLFFIYYSVKSDYERIKEFIYVPEYHTFTLTLSDKGDLSYLIYTDSDIPIRYMCYLFADFEVVYGSQSHGNEVDINNKKIYCKEKSPDVVLDNLPVGVCLFKIKNVDKDLLWIRHHNITRKAMIFYIIFGLFMTFVLSVMFLDTSSFNISAIIFILVMYLVLYIIYKDLSNSMVKEIELLNSNDVLPIRIGSSYPITFVLTPTKSIHSELFRDTNIEIDTSINENYFDVLNNKVVMRNQI